MGRALKSRAHARSVARLPRSAEHRERVSSRSWWAGALSGSGELRHEKVEVCAAESRSFRRDPSTDVGIRSGVAKSPSPCRVENPVTRCLRRGLFDPSIAASAVGRVVVLASFETMCDPSCSSTSRTVPAHSRRGTSRRTDEETSAIDLVVLTSCSLVDPSWSLNVTQGTDVGMAVRDGRAV